MKGKRRIGVILEQPELSLEEVIPLWRGGPHQGSLKNSNRILEHRCHQKIYGLVFAIAVSPARLKWANGIPNETLFADIRIIV